MATDDDEPASPSAACCGSGTPGKEPARVRELQHVVPDCFLPRTAAPSSDMGTEQVPAATGLLVGETDDELTAPRVALGQQRRPAPLQGQASAQTLTSGAPFPQTTAISMISTAEPRRRLFPNRWAMMVSGHGWSDWRE